jgi:hypothetical protein
VSNKVIIESSECKNESKDSIVFISKPKFASELDKLSELGFKLVIKHSQKHLTYKIKMKNFVKLNMIRWVFNRPVNIERAHEIAENLIYKKNPLTFMFQCTYNFPEYNFEIVDGMHRYYAIKQIHQLLEESLDSNDWFYNSMLLVEIKLDYSVGEIVDWFQSINKCSPVLDLYLNSNNEKKEIVEEVVNTYYSKYTIHFKGLKPNLPNTSKEIFSEIVSEIYDKFNISVETKRVIFKILDDINCEIKEKITTNNPKRENPKITQTAIDKCMKTKLYLFIVAKEKLLERINNYKL